MKIKLPIQTKEFVNGKQKIVQGEKEFDLDTSLASQIRWEARFPEQAVHEDLFSYTQRIAKQDQLSGPVLISKMKTLYCWFDTDLTFIEFLKMFDLSDAGYIKNLTGRISEVWKSISDSSAEKNSISIEKL